MRRCPQGKVYDLAVCACVDSCVPTKCQEGCVFDADQCACVPTKCQEGYVFDTDQCACVLA